jgi:hypothetical protein
MNVIEKGVRSRRAIANPSLPVALPSAIAR